MSARANMTADTHIGPGARIGNYVVDRRLGSGGMGSVFAARHVGLDKPVAIKSLHYSLAASENAVIRFVREGRAASRIRHPHVVDVTDVGTHEGVPYLVMEFLEGEDLQTRLHSCRRFTDAEIARIMLPVCDALATAHDMGVVHRDLKPSNIFLSNGPGGREHPMVLDFGLAKILETERVDRVTITQNASYLGTPYYSSPEQAQGGANADAKSDQYSLGAIIYELATGTNSVAGDTPYAVLCAIVAGQTKSLRETRPDVSLALEAIVEKAMSPERERRYESVRELGAALLALADPATAAQWRSTFQPSPLAPTPPPIRHSDPVVLAPVTRAQEPLVAPAAAIQPAAPKSSRVLAFVLAGAVALCFGALAFGVWAFTSSRAREPAASTPAVEEAPPSAAPPATPPVAPPPPPVVAAPPPEPPPPTQPVAPVEPATPAAPEPAIQAIPEPTPHHRASARSVRTAPIQPMSPTPRSYSGGGPSYPMRPAPVIGRNNSPILGP